MCSWRETGSDFDFERAAAVVVAVAVEFAAVADAVAAAFGAVVGVVSVAAAVVVD